MARDVEIRWLEAPDEQNYPAAESYLSLVYPENQAAACVRALREAKLVQYKAKDLFRASGLSLLGVSNSHVEKDRKKILSGQKLSPLLLVRDPAHGKLVVADGYHRLCSVYLFNEDALIPCKIIGLP